MKISVWLTTVTVPTPPGGVFREACLLLERSSLSGDQTDFVLLLCLFFFFFRRSSQFTMPLIKKNFCQNSSRFYPWKTGKAKINSTCIALCYSRSEKRFLLLVIAKYQIKIHDTSLITRDGRNCVGHF